MKNTTKHSLVIREARDLMKEARVPRGFYPVVVPIRSDKPTGRGKGDSSNVKKVSGKTGRGKGGRGSKGSGRPCDSRGCGRNCKGRGRSGARDGPSSSQVCFSSAVRMIIGRVIVQRWMLARRIRRNETLEPTHMVRGPAAIVTILVMKSSSDSFQVDPLCDAAKTTMSVKLMKFWWNLKVSVFWTVVQPPRLVASRALKPCSPRVMNMILEFQRLIRWVVDHSTLEMVLHQRLLRRRGHRLALDSVSFIVDTIRA